MKNKTFYCIVARSTRAWIETFHEGKNPYLPEVARSTRAWIETATYPPRADGTTMSHALRVRGLKQILLQD